MSKRYIEFSNGTKLAIPEHSDPKNELKGNSPIPDQDLGNGVYIKNGVWYGINAPGGSSEGTLDLIRKLENQEHRKKLMFGSWEHSEEPKDKTRH